MHAAFEPLLDAATVRGLLAEPLPRFLGADLVVADCELVHARRRTFAKPANAGRTFLTVSYRVGLGTPDCPHVAIRSELLHGRATLGEPADLPARLPTVFSVAVPPVRLELRRFPDDAALPQLAALADPQRARQMMPLAALACLGERVDDGTGDPHPLHVRVANFRPGERCTLAYSVEAVATGTDTDTRAGTSTDTSTDAERVYVKVFADAHAGVVATRIAWLAESCSTPGRRLLVPRLLGYDATLRAVWQEAVSGTPPLAALGGPAATDALAALASALAELHAMPSAIAPVTRRERVVEAARKAQKLAQACEDLAPSLHATLALCTAALESLPAERFELRHGDAHLGQFLLVGARVAMFDCDELARGDLEQDLAALVVELEDCARDGRCTHAAPAALLKGYAAAPDAPRSLDPALYDFHYRLQRLDRAYRDWWRRGAVAADDVRRSIALAAAGARA